MNVDRKTTQALIELSTTPEKKDDMLQRYYPAFSTAEKIVFLRGMLDIQIIDQREDDSPEFIYQLMCEGIVHHNFS